MAADPVLSVVLAADSAHQAREVARALSFQKGAEDVELVLVCPEDAPADPAELGVHDRLWGIAVVPVAEHRSLHRSRAVGIRAARGPIVAVAETHAYPQPGWLEAVLDAFADPDVVVVGPAMTNATGRTAIGWSNFLLDYGPWAEPVDGGADRGVPGHNSVFRRDAMLALGDDLEELLRVDLALIDRLTAAGGRLHLEPRARVAHLSVEYPMTWVRERALAGRLFATVRANGWTRGRRVVYAVGAPAIPLVRAPRVRQDYRRTRRLHSDRSRRVAAATALGLVASAFGEHLGYAYGMSQRAEHALLGIELDRVRYVRRG